jgi:hypothetical protein
VSNIEERIVLGAIAYPPGSIPLTLAARSKDRYYLNPVLKALKDAGVTIIKKDQKAKVMGIMNKLEVGNLIVEKEVPHGKGGLWKELSLTDKGWKVLNNDGDAAVTPKVRNKHTTTEE